MAIEPIKGFYVHDEATNTDGVAKYDYGELANLPFGDNVTEVSYKTRPGYINTAGNQEGPGAETQEVYTNKILCFPGDTFTIDLDWNGYTGTKWVAFATFDADGRFIARNVFGGWNTNATTATLTTPAIPSGAYYIAFTYRTYGDCTVNIKYEGSYFDIRNRADKGLLLSDEWDTIHGIDSEAATNGVFRLGYVTISNFVYIAGKILVIEKDASYTSALWANVAYFDGDKNYLSLSGWKQTSATFEPPTGAVYARVEFDATNNPNTASGSPTPETVRENTRIYTTQTATEEVLTPIIGGAGYPILHTTQKTLEIPFDTLIFKNGRYYSIGSNNNPTIIDLTATSSSAKRVYYNISNNTFEVVGYGSQDVKNPVWQKDRILLCTMRLGLTGYPDTISINSPYYIDDKYYGINTSDLFEYDAFAWAFGENVKGVNHRGYSTAPENTLPAYKLSKQMGFKYCECDVSMTSDRVPVLLHDDTINRTARNADGTEISETINIGSITYEEALEYDFGIYKSSDYAGTKIPKFEDFIILCRNLGLHPYIELKTAGGYTESEIQNLVDIVHACGMDGKVSWISFGAGLLTYVKNYDSSARLGYVVGDVDASVITTAQGLKTANNDVFIDAGSALTAEEVSLCSAADIPLEVWTVNSESTIQSLDPYVSGVTSDKLIAAKVLYDANKD